jgi:hypothetical protein
MGAVIEVKYFNSFLLKKVNNNGQPIWNGSKGIPADIGGNPVVTSTDNNFSFAIEESRIRGGYNNTSLDYGVKAYLVEDEPMASVRGNSLIYSGIFNSRTGVNNTNVFSVGEDITKSADPANGSIQKLYAEDTNLVILQEAKVSRALIDKDAIYSAEGGGAVTSASLTIGTIQPYAGNFGISRDPGSFAAYGYRKYFTDRDRNAIIRLSMDGITEISNYGMYDYFRDEFSSINSGAVSGKVIGGWDVHAKQYTLSTQRVIGGGTNNYKTLTFDESINGWTSFFTYKPDQILSLRNKFYTLKDGKLWGHYSENVNRGSFYGQSDKTSVTFIFNPKVSMSKVFKTVNYEGSNGWEINSFLSDETGSDFINNNWSMYSDTTNSIYSYVEGSYDDLGNEYPTALVGNINRAGFDRKENKYFANLVNSSSASPGEVIWGNSVSGIKGYFATVTISTDNATDPGGLKELFAVSANFVGSSY